MKQNHDPFPQTPVGFHLRVEDTLMGLEENEVKYVRKYSLKVIAVAAVLVLLLAVTAVAVVQGSSLRERLQQKGALELAAQVQQLHAKEAKDGFSFSVDEVLWVHDEMYISYTVTVPDDGSHYIYGISVPKLNGEEIFHTSGGYINADGGMNSLAYVLGGEFGNTDTQIRERLYLNPDRREAAGNELNIKAWFFKTDKELVGLADGYEVMALQEERTVECKRGYELLFGDEIPQPDTAYYWVKENEGATRGYMLMDSWPDVNAVVEHQVAEAQDLDDSFFDAEPINHMLVDNYWDAVHEAERVDVDRLASEGVVDLLSVLELDIRLDMMEKQGEVYDDLEQHIFDGDGYTMRISDFLLTNLGVRLAVEISFDDGAVGRNVNGDAMYRMYGLLRMDGTLIGDNNGGASAGTNLFPDGSSICHSEWSYRGVISMDGLEQVQLAYIEDGILKPLDPQIILTPVAG